MVWSVIFPHGLHLFFSERFLDDRRSEWSDRTDLQMIRNSCLLQFHVIIYSLFLLLSCCGQSAPLSGFKLFTRDTAISIFGSLHLHRWAFDTELVYLCQLLGIPMAVRIGSHPPGSGTVVYGAVPMNYPFTFRCRASHYMDKWQGFSVFFPLRSVRVDWKMTKSLVCLMPIG